jgi:hypothetical protein
MLNLTTTTIEFKKRTFTCILLWNGHVQMPTQNNGCQGFKSIDEALSWLESMHKSYVVLKNTQYKCQPVRPASPEQFQQELARATNLWTFDSARWNRIDAESPRARY